MTAVLTLGMETVLVSCGGESDETGSVTFVFDGAKLARMSGRAAEADSDYSVPYTEGADYTVNSSLSWEEKLSQYGLYYSYKEVADFSEKTLSEWYIGTSDDSTFMGYNEETAEKNDGGGYIDVTSLFFFKDDTCLATTYKANLTLSESESGLASLQKTNEKKRCVFKGTYAFGNESVQPYYGNGVEFISATVTITLTHTWDTSADTWTESTSVIDGNVTEVKNTQTQAVVSKIIEGTFGKSSMSFVRVGEKGGDTPVDPVEPDDFKTQMSIQIALRGDYSEEQKVSFDWNDMEKAGRKTLAFGNIPLGSSVYAVAIVTITESWSGKSQSHLEMYGISDTCKIASGDNSISLPLQYIGKEPGEIVEEMRGTSEKYKGTFTLSVYAHAKDKTKGFWIVEMDGRDSPVSMGTYTLSDGKGSPYITELAYQSLGDESLSDGSYHIASGKNTMALPVATTAFTFTSENGVTVNFEKAEKPEAVAEEADASGKVSFDQGNMPLISISKSQISVLGDSISLTADTDADDVSYAAKLLYNGVDTECTEVSDGTVSVSQLLVTGSYQLYVTATYSEGGTSRTASQTFDIDVEIPSFTLYVSPNGSDSADGMSESNALSSLTAASNLITAYSELTDNDLDWTIHVAEGTYTGAQEISLSSDGNIKSVTIEGAGSDKTIFDGGFSADNEGRTLFLDAKTITLSDVTIRGGYTAGSGAGICLNKGRLTANNVSITGNIGTGNGDYGAGTGAGIYISNGAVFIMNGGTITNNVGSYGGGVRNNGTMFMYGDAVIGNKDASAPAAYDETNSDANFFGNRAEKGGGIYSDGNMYLGYSGFDTDGTTPLPADFSGGIYQNFASAEGGGIYLTVWESVYMNSGTISYNTGTQGSGVWTTIGYNSSNTACGLFMSGSALVTSDNDVYLESCYDDSSRTTYYAYIYVAGALTSETSPVAKITPPSYSSGLQVLKVTDDAGVTLADVYEKFAVTPDGESVWTISESGTITSN